MANSVELVVFGLLFISPVFVWSNDVCEVHGTVYTYCEDGYYCCDSNTRCCYNGIAPGLVAGIVIASIIGICFLGAIIYVAVTRYKKRGRRTVQPVQTISVSTIHQSNSFRFVPRPPQPPAYSQHDTSSHYPPCQPGGSANHYTQQGGASKYASRFYPNEQPPPYSDICRGSSEPPSYIQ